MSNLKDTSLLRRGSSHEKLWLLKQFSIHLDPAGAAVIVLKEAEHDARPA